MISGTQSPSLLYPFLFSLGHQAMRGCCPLLGVLFLPYLNLCKHCHRYALRCVSQVIPDPAKMAVIRHSSWKSNIRDASWRWSTQSYQRDMGESFSKWASQEKDTLIKQRTAMIIFHVLFYLWLLYSVASWCSQSICFRVFGNINHFGPWYNFIVTDSEEWLSSKKIIIFSLLWKMVWV